MKPEAVDRIIRRADALCTCPRRFSQRARFVIDGPGAYRAGCDTCHSFVWVPKERTS